MGMLKGVIAIVLVIIVGIPLFICGLLIRIINLNNYLEDSADALDKFGNIICAPMFNIIMIKQSGYKFGNADEFMSTVFRKNKDQNTNRILGSFISFFLKEVNDPSFKN